MPTYIAGALLFDPLAKITEPQGRLSGTTADPYSLSAVAAGGTIYYAPTDKGNQIPIWNGSTFQMYTFAELSKSLSGLAAGKIYDVFVGLSGGTPTLFFDAAWTNDTTPAAGTSTNPRAGINRVNGIMVNEIALVSGPAVGFATFVGSVRTDAGGATVTINYGTVGTAGWCGIFNAYNRIEKTINAGENTASWTYSSAVVRAMNNSALMRGSILRTLREDVINCYGTANGTTAAVIGTRGIFSIGIDQTTATGQNAGYIWAPTANAITGAAKTNFQINPGIGFHFFQGLESADGTNNITWAANGLSANCLTVVWEM